MGRSDRRDPFFKGLRFAPASDVATIADRSVARIDLGQSGGYAIGQEYSFTPECIRAYDGRVP